MIILSPFSFIKINFQPMGYKVSENPRVGSSILSLGTIIKTGTYEQSKVPVFIFSLGNGWEKVFKN